MDYDYPAIGLNPAGNAHHNLSRSVQNSPDFVPTLESAKQFLQLLDRPDRASNIVISSENFMNCIVANAAVYERFTQFVSDATARNDRIVFVFAVRQFSRLFESMYLQKLKTGRQNPEMANFVEESKNWVINFFRALTAMSAKYGRENLILIDLEQSGGDILPVFLTNIGLSRSHFSRPDVRLNEKLGLKKSAFLYRLQYSAEGLRNERTNLDVKRVSAALLRADELPSEISNYRVIPFEGANAIQDAARRALPAEFESEFRNASRPELESYTSFELPMVPLTESEIFKLTHCLPRYLRPHRNGDKILSNDRVATGKEQGTYPSFGPPVGPD